MHIQIAKSLRPFPGEILIYHFLLKAYDTNFKAIYFLSPFIFVYAEGKVTTIKYALLFFLPRYEKSSCYFKI